MDQFKDIRGSGIAGSDWILSEFSKGAYDAHFFIVSIKTTQSFNLRDTSHGSMA